MAGRKAVQNVEQEVKTLPDVTQEVRELPTPKQKTKDKPSILSPENSITFGNTLIEIKPTKVKYQRNRTAVFYKILEMYPLAEILAMDEGMFGDDRDGDKCVMDWLIAVTDNEQLVVDNYDDIDTETVERLLAIFKRINKIDEKEEKQKNLTAPKSGA